MDAINRADFLLPSERGYASLDMPLTIGYGQTNSQPSTVRRMLEWLDPQPGDKVLDVGSGSGWTTALLSRLVGRKGHVCAVERISELVKMGRRNCRKYNFKNVSFHRAGAVFGLPAHAPYDRILVSAAARSLPLELIDQLTSIGTIVIPVGSNILEIHKSPDGDYATIPHYGFVFVPLIEP
jgi:protein-L-isoaspartate(D-aspartate) O-methyltransferase